MTSTKAERKRKLIMEYNPEVGVCLLENQVTQKD